MRMRKCMAVSSHTNHPYARTLMHAYLSCVHLSMRQLCAAAAMLICASIYASEI